MIARLILAVIAALAAALALASSASAAVTCSFAGGTLDIDATTTSSFVTIKRDDGAQANDILVRDAGDVAVPCAGGTPTVNTTDSIAFDASTASGTTMFLDLENGTLAPGATDEPGSSDEIELTFTGSASHDQVSINGTGAGDSFRFGAPAAGVTAANLNGAESDGVDADINATSVNRVFADGLGGDDTITADGSGGGVANPVTFDVSLLGSGDNDTLVSGNGANNALDGGAGNDTMTGGSGIDSIDLDEGNDTGNGAGGTDSASYLNWNQGVTVDLRVSTPQNTGGAGTDTLSNFEDAVGSNESDTLIGTDGQNSLVGGQLGNDAGDDTLIGNGGPDTLNGAPGDDTLVGGQGNDSLIGAEGNDTASYATGSTAAVTLSLDLANTGTPQNTGGAGNDTLADSFVDPGADHDVENLIGSPFGGDSLTGNGLANVIESYGDGLGDTLNCVAGNDGDLAITDEVGIDSASNCETVDTAAQTTIQSGPADGSSTNDSTPTFDLAADEPAEFELSIDNAPYVACSDPCTVPALSEGPHTLRFRALDLDGNDNPDASPAERDVTVDVTAPTVSIAAGPQDVSNDATPEWSISAAGQDALECRIDGGAFAPCSGPGSHTAQVGDGPHEFEVRALDAAGNQATAGDSFTVDTAAPDTQITKGPKVRSSKRKAKVAFSAPGAQSFECKLDRGAYATCQSPLKTKRLRPGKHRIAVRAIDAAGNVDPTPATVKFRIVKKKRR